MYVPKAAGGENKLFAATCAEEKKTEYEKKIVWLCKVVIAFLRWKKVSKEQPAAAEDVRNP